jgi:RimJ/RimL family protein N-acetyltransferase
MPTKLDPRKVQEFLNLGDGNHAVMRPIAPNDAAALIRFHAKLSGHSIQMRFFYPHLSLRAEEVALFTQVDGTNRVAYVVSQEGDIVAVGRYDRLGDPPVAEVAFVVADELQQHGIASLLLRRLASRAREVGITTFFAEVLADNAPMLAVFHQAGFPAQSSRERDTVTMTMDIGCGRDGASERDAPDELGPPTVEWVNFEVSAELLSSGAQVAEAETRPIPRGQLDSDAVVDHFER